MSKIDSIKSAGAGAASFANHVIGGAVVGAAVNTAAYANGGALTNSQTAGQAFMSGAGWGAAIGGGFGVGGYKRAMKLSAAARQASGKAEPKAEAGIFEKIRHTAGDMATSLYGSVKSMTPAGKAERLAKENALINQAQNLMDNAVRNMDRHTGHVQLYENGGHALSSGLDSPAYLRRPASSSTPASSSLFSPEARMAEMSGVQNEINGIRELGGRKKSLEQISAKRNSRSKLSPGFRSESGGADFFMNSNGVGMRSMNNNNIGALPAPGGSAPLMLGHNTGMGLPWDGAIKMGQDKVARQARQPIHGRAATKYLPAPQKKLTWDGSIKLGHN